MFNLTELSLRRPITIAMVFLCFVVVGLISTKLVPVEYFPEISEPDIDIWIPYPGSSPEEVERLITRPSEEVLATISGIKEMSSWSTERGADLEIVFDWSVDTDIKGIEAQEKLESIRHLLPDDVERIYVQQESTSDWPILNLRISSERDLSNAYDMLNRNIKRRLERLDGISRVILHGVEKKEIRIELIADRLAAHKVSLESLAQTLQRSSFSISAGRITDNNQRFRVRPVGDFTQLDDISNLVVGENHLLLSDIANITYESPVMDHGRHLDGSFAIGLEIHKESGANTVEVAERVDAEIAEIGKLPEMKGISIYYMDNMAEGILSSLSELLKAGGLGALLAIFVLYFFLRRIGTTLLVTLAVPFSLLVTMAFLYVLGITLNVLSMMGLMLAVGMLVDNAVVVTESIHRYQLKNGDQYEATRLGVKEVAMAVTAGTSTTAIVFLPGILSADNEIFIYLSHVAITICIALGASLLISQTIIPLLASRMPHREKVEQQTVIHKLVGRYSKILAWTLRRPFISFGLIMLVLISVIIPMGIMGSNDLMDMFPQQEDRRLRLYYNINGNFTLDKIEDAVDVYEKYLFENKDKFEIKSVYSYYQGNFASSTILLKDGNDADKSMDEIRELIRADLPRLAIANPSFSWRSMTGRGGSTVQIYLRGESTQRLIDLAPSVIWTLEQMPGLTDVRSEVEAGSEEVHVSVDREKARRFGFSTQQVANSIATSMRGQNLRRFRSEEGEIDVRVQFQDMDRQNLDHLKNLPLFANSGEYVKLGTIAEFNISRGFENIRRLDRITRLSITAQLAEGITSTAGRKQIETALADFDFPPGYSWDTGQRFNDDEKIRNAMLLNIGMALIMIYILMAALFESMVYPAVIWSSILFSIVGVFWFFLFTWTIFSLMAMIGILILIGVVVNNGIVLIDHINQLRARGHARNEAIMIAGQERFRPIMMTAGTTVLGLLPLCFGTTQIGGDGPPYFPMARAIVGGLAFSTLITLVALPSIYVWMDALQNWGKKVVALAKSKS